MTDVDKRGRVEKVSLDSRSFAVLLWSGYFRAVRGEVVGDGTNHSVKATCTSFRNRAFLIGFTMALFGLDCIIVLDSCLYMVNCNIVYNTEV